MVRELQMLRVCGPSEFWITLGFISTYKVRVSLGAGKTAGGGTALQAGRSRVGFPMVSLEFLLT